MAAYPAYAGPIVVNGGSYASAPLAGGGAVTLQLVQDLADGETERHVPEPDRRRQRRDRHPLLQRGQRQPDVQQGSFAGVISGAGSLTKTTGGTLTLSGNNTYSGATDIQGGTLQIGSALPTGVAAYYSFDAVAGTSVFNGGSLANKDGQLVGGAGVTTGGGGCAAKL